MRKIGMEGKVVVVGSINTDLVARTSHLPRPGETVSCLNYAEVGGGKGANQAIAAARIGASVAMIGCVGHDEHGRNRMDELAAEGIDCGAIRVQHSQPTGLAMITVSEEGENSIVVVPGSNSELTPDMVRRHEGLLRSSDVVVCQLETPDETVFAALELARRIGKVTILNPGPARAPLHSNWLGLIDYLVPNETEASLLSGLIVESPSSAHRACLELQRAGASNVVVTLGEGGAYLMRADGRSQHFMAPKVNAVDSTAAGDTFIGVLAAQLASRKSVEDAIELAQKAASISVTRPGAQPSIPTLAEVERMSDDAQAHVVHSSAR